MKNENKNDIPLTKYDLLKLRKASEGRERLTKQLYDVIQKVFKWLDEVTPIGLEIEITEKGTKRVNHILEKKLDPITYVTKWFYDGIDIILPYEAWQNKMISNPLIQSLSKQQIMTIAMHIDIIIGNIRLQLSDDNKELSKALNYVKGVLQKEVKE